MPHPLSTIISPDKITEIPENLAHYGRDWLKDYPARPSCIVFPTSPEEVSAILAFCTQHKIAIVPSAGRTGLSGGATATHGEVILSVEKLNKILSIDTVARVIRVQAGVITQRVQIAAEEAGLYFPVEFTTKGSSLIGGNIATNAGGIRVVKYGMMRDWVLSLTVVTGTGSILHLNGDLIKNNTGYDLRHLFIGSEGTLGVITEATLKLCSRPYERVRILAATTTIDNVLQAFHTIRSSSLNISAFEYFSENGLAKVLHHHGITRPFSTPYPEYFLLEIECGPHEPTQIYEELFEKMIEQGLIVDAVISTSHGQAEELLALRERISETLSTFYYPHKNDISVPISSIPQFTHALQSLIDERYPQFETVIFGHIGDGNLHVNVLKPPAMETQEFLDLCHTVDHSLFKVVKQFSGSISAEHGVGMLKRDFLTYTRTPEEIEIMRGIKKIFDPAYILNPGKIFSSP